MEILTMAAAITCTIMLVLVWIMVGLLNEKYNIMADIVFDKNGLNRKIDETQSRADRRLRILSTGLG